MDRVVERGPDSLGLGLGVINQNTLFIRQPKRSEMDFIPNHVDNPSRANLNAVGDSLKELWIVKAVEISVNPQKFKDLHDLNRRVPQVTVAQDTFYDFVDLSSSRVVYLAHSWLTSARKNFTN
jgi:hypothetical protein